MHRTHKPGVGGSNPPLATIFMNSLKIFCITLNPKHENIIRNLSYIPVGLGTETFSKNCLTDKTGENIANKNLFYGEYTFHYWIWKNYLKNLKTEWVGFCQYRKFFVKEELDEKNISFDHFKKILINNENLNYEKYDCILGNKFSVENYKISKIFKNHLIEFIKNPILIFNKKKRNLKFHFDLFHGKGNLDLSMELLNADNKNDFKNYMKNKTSFNPHNMFICKTKILKNYYDAVFPWLKKCEEKFGFHNLKGYGLKRIYGFLAERFLSYWFKSYTKSIIWPIYFKNIL